MVWPVCAHPSLIATVVRWGARLRRALLLGWRFAWVASVILLQAVGISTSRRSVADLASVSFLPSHRPRHVHFLWRTSVLAWHAALEPLRSRRNCLLRPCMRRACIYQRTLAHWPPAGSSAPSHARSFWLVWGPRVLPFSSVLSLLLELFSCLWSPVGACSLHLPCPPRPIDRLPRRFLCDRRLRQDRPPRERLLHG